jgi:holliday junction DNA helicase RuvA
VHLEAGHGESSYAPCGICEPFDILRASNHCGTRDAASGGLFGGFAVKLTNAEIARKLQSHAAVLAGRGDNLYRVRAFRQAAFAVLGLQEPLDRLLERSGRRGLTEIRGIGSSLAETLEELVASGTIPEKEAAGDGCRVPSAFGLMPVCSSASATSSN